MFKEFLVGLSSSYRNSIQNDSSYFIYIYIYIETHVLPTAETN